ncbi:hypothetical protein GGI15_001125 [Coemansia interrupta]|uniref:Uncharacterized protein n=1 Tax=Coemansia interrupta TaxID=1126814 RepID=A0A9W8HKD4_9FUNG|nr:hypothetical protein GGI15_001125 [Coemansia interrupta]
MATTIISESAVPDTPQHTFTGLKLGAQDIDTFSPLSSSTITIASLGSSLGISAAPKNGLALVVDSAARKTNLSAVTANSENYVQGNLPIDDDDDDDGSEDGASDSSIKINSTGNVHENGCDDEAFDSTNGVRSLGIRGIPGNSLSYSSANMSSTVSDRSDTSIEMPMVNMRSVSADYTSAYGLHIKSPNVGPLESTDIDVPSAEQARDTESEQMHSRASDAQAAPISLTAVETTATVSSSLRSKGTNIQRSLTKKLFRPLTWMQPSTSDNNGGGCVADPKGNSDSLSALAPTDVTPSERPSTQRQHLQRKSVAVVRQTGAHPLSKDNTKTEDGNLAEYDNDNDDGNAAGVSASHETSPTVGSVPDPQLQSRHHRQRAVPSKSLDISRRATGILQSRGPLSRRAMQRSKGEDAIYGGGGLSPSASSGAVGPARFQALPRSLVSRLGFASTLASRRQPGDIRFIIAPHPQFPEIVEVIDCDEMTPVYRKVSRSGKSWHETFHEVDPEDYNDLFPTTHLLAAASGNAMLSDYEMACALGLPYPGAVFAGNSSSIYSSSGRTSLRNSESYYHLSGAAPRPGGFHSNLATNPAASCVTFQSSGSSSVAAADGHRRTVHQDAICEYGATPVMGLLNQSTASFMHPGTVRMTRAGTSMGMYGGNGASNGTAIDKNLLWEALTPYPNQFPLHIKGARTMGDSISLASLVLDRQLFCYRFQLGNTRMRWSAKRARKHQLALQCFVRNTPVAEVFVDYERGYSPYNVPNPRSRKQGIPGATAAIDRRAYASNSSSGVSTPMESDVNGASEDTAVLPDDGTYPIVTILPAAFTQLSNYDTGLVESFIVFSGLQMLECLHV